MNWQIVRIIFTHELRMLLRYRRTVVLAIVLPLLTAPLILFTMKLISDREEQDLNETVFKYVVSGSQADQVRSRIARARQGLADAQSDDKGEHADLIDLQIEEVLSNDPLEDLRSGDLHFYLEAFSGEEAERIREEEASKEAELAPVEVGQRGSSISDPEWLSGVPLVRINYLADRRSSAAGRSLMRELLVWERRNEKNTMLQQMGFPIDLAEVLPIEETNIATAGQVTGSYVGRFLTLVLMMLMLTGGSVVAMDIIAGEKERGSPGNSADLGGESGRDCGRQAAPHLGGSRCHFGDSCSQHPDIRYLQAD